jgi:type II secretory pathway pseudopilin PulG
MRDSNGPLGFERGFTLIDTLVALAVVGVALVAILGARGAHPPERRIAALALQGALAETRALAGANADLTSRMPTGATLTVVPLASGGTRLAVFASRPIAGTPPLARDAGFPPLTLPVAITIPGLTLVGQPFTILVSSAGYASIAGNYAYDPARPRSLAADPGCNEADGVTIAIADEASSEVHPFECRGARYDANTPAASATGAESGSGS